MLHPCWGIVVLSRNMFWTYNSRYTAFKSANMQDVKKKIKDQSEPGILKCFYNKFFDMIVVCDDKDIYLY